ncbi:hypothetical protein Gasu2_08340 [Galdieria sulphuraria]|nr:hypothetical protein Gasu2_08340 [Galdieria sulphuraria]
MTLDSVLRKWKEDVLRPFVKFCPFHPITITIISFVTGLFCVFCCFYKFQILALLSWFINRFLDGLDGVIARVRKQESALGAYIDILSDFTIYGWIPISLTFEASWANQNDIYSLWLTLAILESLYFVNSASLFYLAAILEQRQAGKLKTKEMTHVTMCEALIGGTETILFYSLMIILPRFYLPFLFLLFALLVFFSILQRLWWAVFMTSVFVDTQQVLWNLAQRNAGKCNTLNDRNWKMQSNKQPGRYPFEDEWRERLKRKLQQEKIVRQVMSQVEELRLRESLDDYIESELQHIRNHIIDNFRQHRPQIMNKGIETAKRVSGHSLASWNKQFLQLFEASNSMKKDIAEDNRKLNTLVLKYKKRTAKAWQSSTQDIVTSKSSLLNGTSEVCYPVGMSSWKVVLLLALFGFAGSQLFLYFTLHIEPSVHTLITAMSVCSIVSFTLKQANE